VVSSRSSSAHVVNSFARARDHGGATRRMASRARHLATGYEGITEAGVLRNARQPIASCRFLSILMTTPSRDRQEAGRESHPKCLPDTSPANHRVRVDGWGNIQPRSEVEGRGGSLRS